MRVLDMVDTRSVAVPKLAIDLGTANTRLASVEAPLLAEIPSTAEGSVQTAGSLALTPRALRPVAHGVVVDVASAARMLVPQIRAARRHSPWKPLVLVCYPSDASAEERECIAAAVLTAGAGHVRLVPEPVAALLGSLGNRSFVDRPRLVIDLGEGVIDIAVVQGRRILASAPLRSGLAELRDDLQNLILEEQGIRLLPTEVASLLSSTDDAGGWVPVSRTPGRRRRARPDGRRLLSQSIFVKGAVVSGAVNGLRDAIGRRTSELLTILDTRDSRVVTSQPAVLAGGGALLPRLGRAIGAQLAPGVRTALDPMHAVIRGARRLLQDDDGSDWAADYDSTLFSPAQS
jgi:rod shape-determining protein MreB